MPDPILRLLLPPGTEPGDAPLQVGNDKRLDIIYVITPNGHNKIRLILPVYDHNDNNETNAGKALFYLADWDSLEVQDTASPTNVASTSRPTDSNGIPFPGVTEIVVKEGVAEVRLKVVATPGASLTPLKVGTIAPILNCGITFSEKGDNGRYAWKKAAGSAQVAIVDDKVPSIIEFYPDKLFIAPKADVTLTWLVQGCDRVSILAGSIELLSSDQQTQLSGSVKDKNVLASTTYTLTLLSSVTKNNATPAAAKVPVTVIENGAIMNSIENPFSKQRLMGLYAHDSRLYALTYEKNNLNGDFVHMWETTDGFNWITTTVNNQQPAFAYAKDGNAVNIATEYAGSPGIIFNNQLFLIGGSRYDPDCRQMDVYSYDFTTDEGWQKIDVKGVQPTPRSGHACIVFNDQIWMIGGFTDEGSVDEVWTFNGNSWKQEGALPGKRSFASAINFKERIYLFGGFGNMPDNPDIGLDDSWSYNGRTWEKVPLKEKDAKKFSNCTAAVWRATDAGSPDDSSTLFLFTDHIDDDNNHTAEVIQVNSDINGTLNTHSGNVYNLDDYQYNIQTVTYKGVIWLCGLQANVNHEGRVQKLHYFAYNPDSAPIK